MAAGVLLLLIRPGSQDGHAPTADPAEPTDPTVAVLLRTHKAVWEHTGLPTRPGAPLPPGRLVVKSGPAHIEFDNGATVILEGPAEPRLLFRSEADCARGNGPS